MTPMARASRTGRSSAQFMMASWALCGAALVAVGQDAANPLKPPDRSSPRAALKTFLEAGDAVGAFLARDYLSSPSRTEFHHLHSLVTTVVKGLDMSGIPPAARTKTGRSAAMALYETLSRIELPPFEEIPDTGQFKQTTGTNAVRWVIPNTEIALEREQTGPRQGQFLFSTDTVANAKDYYERVRDLDYLRPVPLEHMEEIATNGGGWLVRYSWIQALPWWLRVPLGGQAGWKWITLSLVLILYALSLRTAYRLSHRGSNRHPFLQALAQLALPAFLLLATPVVAYLALVQVNLVGDAGIAIELTASAILFLAGAWISWRIAPVVAEAIIASPSSFTESPDRIIVRM